ncbi:WD40 repeat domain-containing protein [Helicobacter sp. 11S02596-1]|uniref:WD40 repeat domain-containing protein n=1 Tax=Helicobacter sp. 11S02596-1 TaxID=1476194 RepID=UPI000BA6B58C|nr:WD40 repeat domain-containing protein [Helicobacter sp. 11S02596-1]PAF41531.1 hypothetical protein BJI48_08405 [Helicobacter sp. 11S02596-1]
MLKIKNKINLFGSILDMTLFDGEYLLADHNYRVYKFSLKEFMFSFSKQVAKDAIPHHRYSKAINCSPDGYLLIPKTKSPIGFIYKIVNNRIFLTSRLKWHEADISVSKFSEDGKYLATGGEDGRVFVYTHPNHRLNTFLSRKPDYISSIVFGKYSEAICYASYDLTLTIYSLKTDTPIASTTTPSVIEDMVFFDSDQKIFYVCKDGEAGIFDTLTQQNDFHKCFSCWMTKIMLEPEENYAYIGTREDVLYIYCLKSNAIAYTINLAFKGVTCIKAYENFIFICFINGSVQIIDKFYKINEFLDLLNQNEFKLAKELAEKHNILLKTLQVYTKVKNSSWQEVIREISQLLKHNNAEKIIEIAQPYFEDPSKEEEIKNYILEKSFIEEFYYEFEKGDYGLAYEIASLHPCIKNLDEYQKIEKYFEEICDVSKYLGVQDPLAGKEEMENLLEPFKNIPEKKLQVATILNHWDKYLLGEKYAKENDFANYFLLAQQCKFLKKSKTYQKTYLKCEAIARQIQNCILSKDYTKAQEYLKILVGVEPFLDFVKRSQNYLAHIGDFLEKCRAKNYAECYKMLELYPEMGTSEEAVAIYKEIFEIFEEAKNIAQSGDTKQTYAKICKFFPLKNWQNKVNITMKIAYVYEMYQALENNDLIIDWEKSIQQYVLRYGKDDEIVNFCRQSEVFCDILENIEGTPQKKLDKNINHIQSIVFTKDAKPDGIGNQDLT